jgi:hypothetical protein
MTQLLQTSNNQNVESQPGTIQPAKTRHSQDLAVMRNQWDAADLEKPCCDNCTGNYESVLGNLNDVPDDEEVKLPSPKPVFRRRLHAQSPSTVINSEQTFVHGQELKWSEAVRPLNNPRAAYNRGVGSLGLDSKRKHETGYNHVDRCAEFDEFLQAL